ncbi:LysM peptidoglycan-binding domain-containing protein [Phycicoccus flavus]|uniref:LysM peptidoglycan-binding domain-containing protein n=1 Tax=Phycicoccus flavus TaxID=2502783 RepID=A0A8T6R520_9MICO|nr:LysM peptidoglycan-binding domain-containing protein [Phycicoccus flavus]NHA69518.1 LysM peptidoglycan-binding domain-containing protein [Phycicoccus flavus]
MQTTPNAVKRTVRVGTAVVLPSVVAVAAGFGLWRVLTDLAAAVRAGAPLTADAALLGLLAAVGLLGLSWLVLGVVLEALARVPGALGHAAASASAALSPRVVRHVAALVLGVGSGVTGAAAHAAQAGVVATVTDVGSGRLALGPSGADTLPDPSWAAAPDTGWTPEPPVVRPQPDLSVLGGRAASRADAAADEAHEVVVRRGDSLWVIAARHLGEGASDAEIAEEWPRWYAANRDVVGPDPDVVRPGQVLRAPAAGAAS